MHLTTPKSNNFNLVRTINLVFCSTKKKEVELPSYHWFTNSYTLQDFSSLLSRNAYLFPDSVTELGNHQATINCLPASRCPTMGGFWICTCTGGVSVLFSESIDSIQQFSWRYALFPSKHVSQSTEWPCFTAASISSSSNVNCTSSEL